MGFRRDMGARSLRRRHSAGFPLAALLWRARGASATWRPPIENCEIGHFLPEGPQVCPSRQGNPMILRLRSICSFVLLLGALVAPMASGAPPRPVQVKTQESVGLAFEFNALPAAVLAAIILVAKRLISRST